MQRLVAALILALLTAWLPLQPSAALSMPFCEHGQAHDAQHDRTHTQHAPQPHDHHAQPSGEVHDGHAAQPVCDSCGACHLACSLVLPAAMPLIGAAAQYAFDPSRPLAPGAFAPDQPHPPPLHA